jgi:hypothetical protein
MSVTSLGSFKALRIAAIVLSVFTLLAVATIVTMIFKQPRAIALIPILVFIVGLMFLLLSQLTRHQRERFLRESNFPAYLGTKLRVEHPGFSAKDADLVEHGLRQFFIANAKSRGKFVAMPSKIADEMWHDFILHTKAYDTWCKQAFGKLLHHTPAEALSKQAERNDGLRRAWYWACKEESIDPRKPTRLPLLFALDKKLGIPGGFHYMPDCSDIAKKSDQGGDGDIIYCGTTFSEGSSSSSSDSYPGDGDGFGGADASSGNGGGGNDGGGDGGGGCGGGGD